MEIKFFTCLLFGFVIFDSVMQALNRRKIEKLHKELQKVEKEKVELQMYDMPISAAIRQIEMRVRNLKCADLCRLCREINQLNTEETSQKGYKEN